MTGSTVQVIEVADAFCHFSVISLSQSDTQVDSQPSMTDRLISGADAGKTGIHLFPKQTDGRHNAFSLLPLHSTLTHLKSTGLATGGLQ